MHKINEHETIITICILALLMNSCNSNEVVEDVNVKKVAEKFSVNAEIIETGNIGSWDCNDGDDVCFYFNRVVQIIIKNNSDDPKSFWIMRCSWQESFRSDIEDISFLPKECDSNYPIRIWLKPDQSITFTGILRQKLFSRYKSYKIGLIMLNENDFISSEKKFNTKYKGSKKTYWSNSLSMESKSFGYKLN